MKITARVLKDGINLYASEKIPYEFSVAIVVSIVGTWVRMSGVQHLANQGLRLKSINRFADVVVDLSLAASPVRIHPNIQKFREHGQTVLDNFFSIVPEQGFMCIFDTDDETLPFQSKRYGVGYNQAEEALRVGYEVILAYIATYFIPTITTTKQRNSVREHLHQIVSFMSQPHGGSNNGE